MSDATTSGGDGPPSPALAASVDELITRLQELRAWSGVSYRELHRRLVRLRRSRGVAEQPAYATVYRCLQPGRRRLDIELVADIITVLTGDETEAGRWRQAYARLTGDTEAPSYAAVFDTLPEDVDDFTGRDAELAAATDCNVRVLAIEGMAGVGKTTFAVRAARLLVEERRPDAILSVNLAGYDPERAPAEPMAVLDGFLRALGEPGPRIQTLDLTQRADRYRELLAGRHALVLLDNAASPEQVEPLLPDDGSPAITLVTSRHRVVEHPAARHVTLDVFPSDQAIDLLGRRIGDAVDQASDTAARIVEQVGRLPLAVAIVASRIEASAGWTLEDHLEHLVERRQSLRLDPGVELAFATSYETLPPSLKRMLRLLALHPGRDCDAYAAAALADIDLDHARRQLADLADASLVGSRTADRFELHDLVRVFALNRAHEDDPPSARRAALTRLLDHYRWASAVAMDLYAPEEHHRRPHVAESGTAVPSLTQRSMATAWLDAERPNLIALGAHAAKHGRPQYVGDLSAVVARYLLGSAHYDDAVALHRDAVSVSTGDTEGLALNNLAVAQWHRGNQAEALRLLQRALEAARASGDKLNEPYMLVNLGNVYKHMGRLDDAVEARKEALAALAVTRDRLGEARALQNLGSTYALMGRYRLAHEHLESCPGRFRSLGDAAGEALSLENLGRLYTLTGRYVDAILHHDRAVALAEEHDQPLPLAEACVGLGAAYARHGELEAALDHQLRGQSIAHEVGIRSVETYAHNELGNTMRLLDRLDDALEHHHEALSVAEEVNDVYDRASAHDGLARTYLAAGALDDARAHWQHALRLHERMRTPDAAEIRSQLEALGRSTDEQ
jgi:tetratricopeptide (TPR) repeat protein